jgi:hypothetical protein
MIESIRCPNCGAIAERHHLSYLAQVKTQCESCDYLLVMCTRSGHVLESYAPGLPAEPPPNPISIRFKNLAQQPQSNNSRRDIAALSA